MCSLREQSLRRALQVKAGVVRAERMRKVLDPPRALIADYLNDEEPAAALWPGLLHTVFQHGSRETHIERLGPTAQVAFLINRLHAEVVNGGFSQFFSNSSGDFTSETIRALETVGSTLSLGLLREAVALFPGGQAPRDRDLRCELLFAFEQEQPKFFDEIDATYYRDVDALGTSPKEDLLGLVVKLMRAHSDESVVVG